jgi:hypothetical protein
VAPGRWALRAQEALAHHWQGIIRSGTVRDQADLARLVGVSRARVTQVMNLLWLAPKIQETVLLGEIDGGGTERTLRTASRPPLWSNQRRARSLGRGGFPLP